MEKTRRPGGANAAGDSFRPEAIMEMPFNLALNNLAEILLRDRGANSYPLKNRL